MCRSSFGGRFCSEHCDRIGQGCRCLGQQDTARGKTGTRCTPSHNSSQEDCVWYVSLQSLQEAVPQHLHAVQQLNGPTHQTMRQSNGHLFVFCKLKGEITTYCISMEAIWILHLTTFMEILSTTANRWSISAFLAPKTELGRDASLEQATASLSVMDSTSGSRHDHAWFHSIVAKNMTYSKKVLLVSWWRFRASSFHKSRERLNLFILQHLVTEESFLGSHRGGAYDPLCTPAMLTPENKNGSQLLRP